MLTKNLRALATTTTAALVLVGVQTASACADSGSGHWRAPGTPDITVIVAAGDHITADPERITRSGPDTHVPASAVCHTGATPLCHIA
ncbi:hypothetical protein [Streptomyces sp. NBC_01264]|uniref:hypothetical protein n=1 Tax=Streptomyces sp. NBC_01264 TaxID=2903804 RepID=UPI0022555404|nr:hypothetical protein [Streptomyces sp. NBC_01264]MCX4784249.1 hypothetical protein [Streptomyces sp. NBC_01264]